MSPFLRVDNFPLWAGSGRRYCYYFVVFRFLLLPALPNREGGECGFWLGWCLMICVRGSTEGEDGWVVVVVVGWLAGRCRMEDGRWSVRPWVCSSFSSVARASSASLRPCCCISSCLFPFVSLFPTLSSLLLALSLLLLSSSSLLSLLLHH